MRPFERRLITLCSAALLAAAPARALAVGAEEDAKTLFARGRELRSAGQCDQAVIAFRSALEIYPEGLGALRNIAECEEELGRYASARRDWWDLRRAALQSNEAKYAGWTEDAEARYRALGSKVGTLTVRLKGAEGKPPVQVVLDGKPLDPRLLGVELERDLGAHTVELFYGGAAPIAERAELAPGARQVVTLTVPAPLPARDAPSAPSASGTPPSGIRMGGYVALGVGGAGAIATVVALAVRAGALSAVEDGCSPAGGGAYECPPSLQGDYDTGKTASTLASVFAGVGLVGIGAGVTLLLLSPSEPTPPAPGKPAAELVLTPTPGGLGSRLLVRF
ncbi:tetratricopeptide repeat protein [Sorangium atrum]|uniref:Tetratricopeptide repeat protein n=1 Tax=Sorangium atrum TaxID=2995308 RepID=A0ABT5C2I4_9BACT|nr:tetratricopeptide repeat protein [Sorangium aterium]MDC0680065.1 tetratricopeptide repeat protein [Sorangium aterium]